MLHLLVDRRQEDDRDAAGLLSAADDLGGLVAVHDRHVDVEQDDRELALEQVAKRLFARTSRNDLAKIIQDALDSEQVPLVVVDQEDARPLGLALRELLRLA